MARRPPIWQREGFSSRRQYENRRARDAGFTNYSQYQRLRGDARYQQMLRGLSEATGQSVRQLRRMDSYFNARVADKGVGNVARELAESFGGGAEQFDYELDVFDWEEFREWYQ